MYAKERDGGDEGGDVHVLLGDSHAAVLRVHRVSPLGDGADRFARGFKVSFALNLIFHLLMLTISVTANENHGYNQSPSTTPITLK